MEQNIDHKDITFIRAFFFLLLLTFLSQLIGCTTVRSFVDDNLDSIPGAVLIANDAVLQYVVKNPDHREQLANDEHAFAVGIRSLMTGKVPTPNEIQNTLNVFSVDASQWAQFPQIVSGLYSSFYTSIKGDPKRAMDVLEKIAEGLEQSAEKIKNS
jgi:hypothetical protein